MQGDSGGRIALKLASRNGKAPIALARIRL